MIFTYSSNTKDDHLPPEKSANGTMVIFFFFKHFLFFSNPLLLTFNYFSFIEPMLWFFH